MKTIFMDKSIEDHLTNEAIHHFFPEKYHRYLRLITYQKGDVICYQGDLLNHISYFLSGKAKVIRRSANGKEHILETIQTPTIIGDIELLAQKTAVSSVIALEDCQLIQLPLFDKAELLSDPLFLYQVGREIALKCYQQNVSSATNITYSVKERLASHILNIANSEEFTLELSLLADAFGTSYRHLNRVVKQMLDENIIQKKRFKHYKITNKKALQALAIQD
ncbi:cyclic nucleotide-binding domain-containing protein [Streptococcus pluranimalium]|uniref:cyclic nucleotide-binding domain-containing protein n=1 Tax=Streptococcus pluranimalium TaxID=82348 RepID=UPI003CC763A4